MDPDRIVGWIAAGVLIGLALTNWTMRRRFSPRIAVIFVCAGLLCGFGGNWYADWRHEHELTLTERSVAVTVRAPGDSLFPIELAVRNNFERMTRVRLRCMVERYATDAVDFLDADVDAGTEVAALEKGASIRFECPAPREIPSPFHTADVRGAHVTLDVTFSVPDRWRRLGVRQGFDLSVGKGRASWTPDAAVLLR